MKFCTKCKLEKDCSLFNINRKKKDGLQSFCRECSRLVNNEGYLYNPNRKKSIKLTRKIKKEFSKRLINRYKQYCGCFFCKEREPVALDMHHLDPKEKDMNIARMIGLSIDRLKAEIRKCVVLCANCHRKVHSNILKLPCSTSG